MACAKSCRAPSRGGSADAPKRRKRPNPNAGSKPPTAGRGHVGPGGGAGVACVVCRTGKPYRCDVRAVASITLSAHPGRELVFWLTEDKGIEPVKQTERGETSHD